MDAIERLKNFMRENNYDIRGLAGEMGIPFMTAYRAIRRVEQGEAKQISSGFERAFRHRFGNETTDAIFLSVTEPA